MMVSNLSWLPQTYFLALLTIKTKKGDDVLQALKLILSGTRKPNTIRTDLGQEFGSKDVNAYLKGQNIHHFYALNTEI